MDSRTAQSSRGLRDSSKTKTIAACTASTQASGHARPTSHHPQTEMAVEAVVVAVRMQQRVVVGDAEGGDQSIDGLADLHTLTTKSSVIPRRGDSNFATRERQKFQRPVQSRARLKVISEGKPCNSSTR